MRILVTGGCGFIGSHLVEHFQGKAHVRVLDNLRTGHRANLARLNAEVIEGSVVDRKTVRTAMQGVDRVFHLAAMLDAADGMERLQECVANNVTGYLNVLEEAAAAGAKKVCFASSSAVYGLNPAVPKLETMLPEPRSPYAVTKLDGETYGALFTETRKTEVVSLRFFNVFGPRQDPASPYAVVSNFIRQALAGEPITIQGDGEQTRDFMHVRDVVAACVFAAGTRGVAGVYNVGYGRQMTINGVVSMILAETRSRSEVRYEPAGPGEPQHSVASMSKFCSQGFRATGNLPNAIRDAVRELRRFSPAVTPGRAVPGPRPSPAR